MKAATAPFLQHKRPTAAECVAVCDALAELHGRPSDKRHVARVGCEIQEPHTVLDSLVRTILSQNTTDTTSQRAFTSLKAAFPDWELVRTAQSGAVEEAIRVGGLADIKAARIKAILNTLLEETGSLSLEHLRTLPCEDVKSQLTKFKGVGPKTVACVLMFCMGRAEFPVDTHVWEISKQLGWVPANATREQTYQQLNGRLPDDIKYDLHVLMVEHGKKCAACGKRGTPQKRKAAAAADSKPCPLAVFKQNKKNSKLVTLGASSISRNKMEDVGGDSDHSVAVSAASAAVVTPAGISSRCKRVKQEPTFEQQQLGTAEQTSSGAQAAAVASKVEVKAEDGPFGAAAFATGTATATAVKKEELLVRTSSACVKQELMQ